MTEKLKPCPFCGGAFGLDVGLEELGRTAKIFYIRCPFCEAQTVGGFCVEEAVEAWNRRANTNE